LLRIMPPRQTKAIAHLKAVDPILGAWIDRAGPCGWEVKADGTHFDHVARSIVYQQVSGAAAATVYGRMLGLYRGKAPTPKQGRSGCRWSRSMGCRTTR